MSRYFFHVIDGYFLADDEGMECAGLPEMRNEAIRCAGEILRDRGGEFSNGLDWQMHVTNEEKKTVLKLIFSAHEPSPEA